MGSSITGKIEPLLGRADKVRPNLYKRVLAGHNKSLAIHKFLPQHLKPI